MDCVSVCFNKQFLYFGIIKYSLWFSLLLWLAAHELQNHNKSINLTEALYLQWTLTLSGGFEVEGLEAPSKSRWVNDIHSVLALTLPVEGDSHDEDDHSDHPRSQTRVQRNINRVLHAWDTARNTHNTYLGSMGKLLFIVEIIYENMPNSTHLIRKFLNNLNKYLCNTCELPYINDYY